MNCGFVGRRGRGEKYGDGGGWYAHRSSQLRFVVLPQYPHFQGLSGMSALVIAETWSVMLGSDEGVNAMVGSTVSIQSGGGGSRLLAVDSAASPELMVELKELGSP